MENQRKNENASERTRDTEPKWACPKKEKCRLLCGDICKGEREDCPQLRRFYEYTEECRRHWIKTGGMPPAPTFFSIESFMTEGLKLGNTKLLVYALIFSFTKGESKEYYGTPENTAKRCGCSVKTAKRTLDWLVENGYVHRRLSGTAACYSANYFI